MYDDIKPGFITLIFLGGSGGNFYGNLISSILLKEKIIVTEYNEYENKYNLLVHCTHPDSFFEVGDKIDPQRKEEYKFTRERLTQVISHYTNRNVIFIDPGNQYYKHEMLNKVKHNIKFNRPNQFNLHTENTDGHWKQIKHLRFMRDMFIKNGANVHTINIQNDTAEELVNLGYYLLNSHPNVQNYMKKFIEIVSNYNKRNDELLDGTLFNFTDNETCGGGPTNTKH